MRNVTRPTQRLALAMGALALLGTMAAAAALVLRSSPPAGAAVVGCGAGARTYVGPDGGSFEVATNWSPQGVPGPGEIACGGATKTVFVGDNHTLAGLAFDGTLSLGGYQLTLSNPDPTLSSRLYELVTTTTGTVRGPMPLQLEGSVAPGAPGNVLEGHLIDLAVTVTKRATISGLRLEEGATLHNVVGSTIIARSGQMNVCDDSSILNDGTFTIEPAVVNLNLIRGWFGCPSTANVAALTNSATGTIVKTGAATANLGVSVRNSGQVTVTTGTLTFGDGPALDQHGEFDVASGATMTFTGGDHRAHDRLSGAGTYRVTNGSLDVNGTAMQYNATGVFEVTGGVVDFETLDPSIVDLRVSGGSVTGRATVVGSFAFGGGVLENSASAAGVGRLTIAGSATSTFTGGRVGTAFDLMNAGSVTQTTNLTLCDDAVVTNGGSWAIVGGAGTIGVSPELSACTPADSGIFLSSGSVSTSGALIVFNVATANTGTLTVTSGVTRLTAAAADHTGGFSVASAGTLQWASGTHVLRNGSVTGAGMYRVLGGSVQLQSTETYTATGRFEVAGGAADFTTTNAPVVDLRVAGGTLGGAVRATSALTWSAGTLAGAGSTTTLAAGAAGTFTGGIVGTGHRLVVAGTATWSTSGIGVCDGAEVAVQGTLLAQHSGLIGLDHDASCSPSDTGLLTVAPSGTVRNTGSGEGALRVRVHNQGGLLEATAGILRVAGAPPAAVQSGTWRTQAPGTLTFLGGTHTLNGGTVTGTGTLRIGSGTLDLSPSTTYAVTGTLLVNGGTVDFDTTNAAAPVVQLQSGVVAGSVRVTTSLAWSGGTLGGDGSTTTLAASATGTLTAAGIVGTGHDLVIAGTMTWTAGAFSLCDGAEVVVTGKVTAQLGSNQQWSPAAGCSPVDDGAIRIAATGTVESTGAGTVIAGSPLTNDGTVDVVSGGVFVHSTPSYAAATLTLHGGRWRVGGELRIPGVVRHVGAELLLRPGSTVLTTAGGNAIADVRSVTAAGALVVGRSLAAVSAFGNAGRVELTAGTFSAPSYAQSSGLTRVGAGATLSAPTVAVDGGTLDGAGTVNGTVTGNGTVAPGTSPGILTVGTFSPGPGSTLAVELGRGDAGSAYDRLVVSGAATLSSSTLALTLRPGYAPLPGDTFTILTAASLTGTFGTVTGTDLPGTRTLVVTVSGSSVVATVRDDVVTNLRIGDAWAKEPASGVVPMTFTVTREGDLTGASSVTVAAHSSGTATSGSDFNAFSTTQLSFAPGETTKTVTVDVRADNAVEYPETVAMRLSAPTGATLADALADGLVSDFDAGTPGTLHVGDVVVGESAGSAVVTLTRSGDVAGGAFVSFQTQTPTGTVAKAAAGTDYTTVPLTQIRFLAGETTKTVSVAVAGDGTDEANEQLWLSVVSTVGLRIADNRAVVTIVDDDGVANPPGPTTYYAIDDVRVFEPSSTSVVATIAIRRRGVTTAATQVQLSQLSTSTASTSDHTAVPTQTLSFAAGETVRSVSVPVRADTVIETAETVLLRLTAVGGDPGVVEDDTGSVVIVDEESGAPASVAVTDARVAEGANGTTVMTFTLTRSGQIGELGLIWVGTVATTGTGFVRAVPGTDYSTTVCWTSAPGGPVCGTSVRVAFPVGSTAAHTVTVTVHGDALVEPDEHLFLDLTSPAKLVVSDGRGLGTILADD